MIGKYLQACLFYFVSALVGLGGLVVEQITQRFVLWIKTCGVFVPTCKDNLCIPWTALGWMHAHHAGL